MSVPDPEHARVRKRLRIDKHSPPTSTSTIDRIIPPSQTTSANMRLTESDQSSSLSVSPDLPPVAGSSSLGLEVAAPSAKAHANGNGFTNGSSGMSSLMGNGVLKHTKSIAKVSLAGTALYDDSFVDREEFVRLVIQSLRDVGYIESAATLEAESGYPMESAQVSDFREYILEGDWYSAEAALISLGVTEDDGLWEAKFLIGQQKYLELLEAQRTIPALNILRNELAPLNVDPEQLHSLTSLIMCSDPDDLRQRAGWDGASGTSRRKLLTNLQRYIPSSVMIPQRRFLTLLQQARSYQRHHCLYHNSPVDSSSFSLYTDHQCDKSAFPRITTAILAVHTDEVWNLEWSHDGVHLASASKDKSAIIWRIGPETEPSLREYKPELILRDHPYAVGRIAWSLDDSILLTSAEQYIKLWNTKTGVCIRVLDTHSETVTSLAWLPDDSGFISGGLDRTMILWDVDGKQRDTWGTIAIRVTDLAITPDYTRLIAVGMQPLPPSPSTIASEQRSQSGDASPASGNGAASINTTRNNENRILVYDLATKQIESSIRLDGELTSVKVSQDSQYALVNHAPDEIHLWDLNSGRLARKFTGQRQGRHVIRSCFGGIDGNFIVSGSEDGNVYVWHRDTGALLEVLSGHGEGSVNSVAWNPRNERMFASCSDDNTIRIWEAPTIETIESTSGTSEPQPARKGKGKTRQQWDSDGLSADFDSGSSTSRL